MSIGNHALSPAQQEQLVRWPPKDYVYTEPSRKSLGSWEKDSCEEKSIKKLFPELSHWSYQNIYISWGEFSEWATWGDYPEPTERDEYFLAYLYLDQELGCGYPDHGGLDEFDEQWKSIGK